jgi:DNA polymerase epsilon subunit 1
VADVANHWIDVIDTRGESLDDDELVDLISENRNMSRQLDDYGDQKGTSQTTARRLGEFLGAEIIKDKGLNCKFIIAEQPYGAPVTERAIPTAIWKAEPAVMKYFLRKWLKAPGLDGDGFDIRNVLDWDYYMERLGKTIQKIITIPAALQKVPNPVPRVPHPDWLDTKVQQLNDKFQQRSILSMFGPKKMDLGRPKESDKTTSPAPTMDIEDFGGRTNHRGTHCPVVHRVRRGGVRNISARTEDMNNMTPEGRIALDENKKNFGCWLEQRKKSWKKSRDERRALRNQAERDSSSGISEARSKRMSTLKNFVQESNMTLTQREWQIVELREMTSSDTEKKGRPPSGTFVAWVMVGRDSLQKIQIEVPRTVYIATYEEAVCILSEALEFRKVDKHLPHNKQAKFLYELTLPEPVYRNTSWTSKIVSKHGRDSDHRNLLQGVYESGMPLMMRALSELGSVTKVIGGADKRNQKSFNLIDLKRVEKPSEGMYLNCDLSYKRCFLYVRINPSSKTGVVALFKMNGGSGDQKFSESSNVDLTSPCKVGSDAFDVSASCDIWIVTSSGQKNLSEKRCSEIFTELLSTIHESADPDSEYACISAASYLEVSLSVVPENKVYSAVSDAIRNVARIAPTLLLLNSSQNPLHLRRKVKALNSLPVVPLPFPPGRAHNPSISTLPAINWEKDIVQLCLEAYLHMGVVSFPKRVEYARYGKLPVGNLGEDENFSLYDVSLNRLLKKNRAVSWASSGSGRPDLGASFLPSTDGKFKPSLQLATSSVIDSEELWSDDKELVSPLVRRPGTYRTLCIDIDLHDLAIAALAEPVTTPGSLGFHNDPTSPMSVLQIDNASSLFKLAEPMGDEMSTATSLPMLRALVASWLKDAFASNSEVADSLLHHVYRFVSSPEVRLHDPALHRGVHALMKNTFMQLLGELQRLGCSIVHATFHKITVCTNKTCLADAEEYINFVISTVRKQMAENGDSVSGLARIAMQPRQFHTQFVFLDEYNFGTIHLERKLKQGVEEDLFIEEGQNEDTVVVPSVVTAWSLMNCMGSKTAQEYFRVVIARFSRDVFKKEHELRGKEGSEYIPSFFDKDLNEKLLVFKKKMISKTFASILTRAVGDIGQEQETTEKDEIDNQRLTLTDKPINPVLEFVKSVTTILELDQQVDTEVHALKRSLLAQIGVAEYSSLAKWENPCATMMLPDCYCKECQETRDINLCYLPPKDSNYDEEGVLQKQIHWFCEECGTEYDVDTIEQRMIDKAHQSLLRYQLQDLRCTKTNRVSTHSLAQVSLTSEELKNDISPEEGVLTIHTLHRLSKYHELERLRWTTEGIITSYQN